jgi:hypothetical protein
MAAAVAESIASGELAQCERELNQLRQELSSEKAALERAEGRLGEALRAQNRDSVQRLEYETATRKLRVTDLGSEVANLEFALGELSHAQEDGEHRAALAKIEAEYQKRVAEVAAAAERRRQAIEAVNVAAMTHNNLLAGLNVFSQQVALVREGKLDAAKLAAQIERERQEAR